MHSFWTVAENTAQKHEIWLLVRLAWFLWCPIKTSEGVSVVASKPKIQIGSTKKLQKKGSLFNFSDCMWMSIAFSPFPRHSLTIAPAIMLQFWGYLHWPWLWEGISLIYMKFYFKILGWIMGASCVMAWGQHTISHHTATATANTLTTQYMVRFSHLTVQLPETRLFHTLDKQEGTVKRNI